MIWGLIRISLNWKVEVNKYWGSKICDKYKTKLFPIGHSPKPKGYLDVSDPLWMDAMLPHCFSQRQSYNSSNIVFPACFVKKMLILLFYAVRTTTETWTWRHWRSWDSECTKEQYHISPPSTLESSVITLL